VIDVATTDALHRCLTEHVVTVRVAAVKSRGSFGARDLAPCGDRRSALPCWNGDPSLAPRHSFERYSTDMRQIFIRLSDYGWVGFMQYYWERADTSAVQWDDYVAAGCPNPELALRISPCG
jgi:hypothetical protein